MEVGNKKKDSRTSPFFSFLDNFRKWLDLSIFTWRCNHRDPSAVFLVPFQDILFHELAGSYTLTAIYALYNSEHSIYYYCSVYLERLSLQHKYHNNYVIAEELIYFLCGFLLHYSQNCIKWGCTTWRITLNLICWLPMIRTYKSLNFLH